MAMPNEAHEALEHAISDLGRLRNSLKRNPTPQVRSRAEKSLVKATVLAWFNKYRGQIQSVVDRDLLQPADTQYQAIMAAVDRASARSTYDDMIKSLTRELTGLCGYTLVPQRTETVSTADAPPDFASIVPDPEMRKILNRRWQECVNCIKAGAPLAATVMMGGLIESLMLARVNRQPDKSVVFGARSAPRDKETQKTLPLQRWTLRHYIDVAHELEWISQSARDVGEILRDYRNYVHPYKELSHGVVLDTKDAVLFWEICKTMSRQLLSTKTHDT